MSASTDIVPFATGVGANVTPQATYASSSVVATGVQDGKASAPMANKAWRQSSFIAAGIANFCVAQNVSVPDDGNLANLVAEITAALTSFVNNLIPAAFPSGTRLPFQQTTPPTGWAKDTTAALHDSVMRIVTGTASSGGVSAFSAWNGVVATGAHTLSTAEIPTHTHPVSDPGHTHTAMVSVTSAQTLSHTVDNVGTQPYWTYPNATTANTTGITVGNAGTGGSHTHPMTNNVKYFDFCIGVKT